MKKIALIGCGNHALKFHAPALARYAATHPDEIELTAVCDLDAAKAEAVRAGFGFRTACTDIMVLLGRERPDGCVCVMPLPAIANIGIILLEAGMPCVIEKPLGACIEDVRRLVATAARTGTPHLVSLNRRFDPYCRQAAAWAAVQGPIRRIRAAMLRPKRREPEFLWATGLHVMDAAAALGGGPTVTGDHNVRVIPDPDGGAAWYRVELRTACGAPADIDILPTCGCFEEVYELYGNGFCTMVRICHGQPTTVLCQAGGAAAWQTAAPASEPAWLTDGTYHETAAFIGALTGRNPWGPGVAEVAPLVELGMTASLLE
jgi:predicted dehydrogenase